MKKLNWTLVISLLLVYPASTNATTNSSVVVSCGNTLPMILPGDASAVSLSFSAVDTDPPPPPDSGYDSTTGPAWSWTASGPPGSTIDVSPASGSATVTVTVTGLSGPAHWVISVTATATYNTGQNQVQRPGSMNADVWAVGVERIQFQLPGGGFQNMPTDFLYVKASTTVNFKAFPLPNDAPSWPAGYPVWGGTCGASGTGETTQVTLDVPSQDIGDYQTITATCGGSVTGAIIRYGPDEGTLSLDFVSAGQANMVSYVATMTYKLWLPAGDDGNPVPYTGYAELDTIDFTQDLDLTLNYRISYPFDNGVQASQTNVIQTDILDCETYPEYGDSGYYGSVPEYFGGMLPGQRSDQSLLARLATGQDTSRRLYQFQIDPKLAELYKTVSPDVKQVVAWVKKQFVQVDATVSPKVQPDSKNGNEQQAVTPQNALGTITLSMKTSGSSELRGVGWLRGPNVLLEIEATPGAVMDPAQKLVPVQTWARMSNDKRLDGMTQQVGWQQISKFNLAGFYPGFAKGLLNIPTVNYAGAVWFDQNLNKFKWTKWTQVKENGEYAIPGGTAAAGKNFGVTEVHFPRNPGANAQIDLWSSIEWSR